MGYQINKKEVDELFTELHGEAYSSQIPGQESSAGSSGYQNQYKQNQYDQNGYATSYSEQSAVPPATSNPSDKYWADPSHLYKKMGHPPY